MVAPGPLARWRRALLRAAYRLLYGPLAALYDLAATVSSGGAWWDWQRAVLPWVQGPRVLDLACGTGHLLADLAEAGYLPLGIDSSPRMMQQARAYQRRRGIPAPLLLGDGRFLPLRDGALAAVVMTFSGLSLDPQVLAEVRRALAPGGRLVLLDQVRLTAPTMRARWSRAVLGLTSTRLEYPTVSRLQQAGFSPQVYEVPVQGNQAVVVVAKPRGTAPPDRVHCTEHREH